MKIALASCWWCVVGATTNYKLERSYVGPDFFSADKWTFFTDPDPTQGEVRYVDMETANQKGMIRASAESVYMGPGLEGVTNGSGVPSVRLESVEKFNAGLFILSMTHQPTGCGVWPAFWMTGDDAEHPWPEWGEADFIEGSHGQNQVWTTLHTLHGCDQSALKSGVDFSGVWMKGLDTTTPSTNCSIVDPTQARNEGCPIVGAPGTMGADFNNGGGGTFAFEWDPQAGHIRGFFWATGQEPEDVKSGNPAPDTWGLPYSKFVLGDPYCPASRFKNMKVVVNTDFCGQWGNLDVTFHEKCPGVPKTMGCNEWVTTFPGNLTEAYWAITRLDVFQNAPTAEEIVV
jgi:hypothetical protein